MNYGKTKEENVSSIHQKVGEEEVDDINNGGHILI
jgi:hypothetical protein